MTARERQIRRAQKHANRALRQNVSQHRDEVRLSFALGTLCGAMCVAVLLVFVWVNL